MKKAVPVFLTLALALSLTISALAESIPYEGQPESGILPISIPYNTEPEDTGDAIQPTPAFYPLSLYGFIVEELENGMILVQSDFDESNQAILNISEDTFIVDAQTGLISSLDARENDRVAVFYGPVTTRSMIPQSNAVAIAVNLPENGRSPHYAKVEQIERGEGFVRILTNGGSLYITIHRETAISPYRTRNIVSIDNLRVGSELMVWYDMVALSYPGQTSATRTVILRDGPVGDTIAVSAEDKTASINGTDVVLLDVYETESGTAMLPLRQLCEALGYTVDWVAETNSVEITRDEISATITFGSPVLTINGEITFLPHAPEVENWVTFVPANFFQTVLSTDVFFA